MSLCGGLAHLIRFRLFSFVFLYDMYPPLLQAKENMKVKEAFQTLVQKILVKSPKAGQDSDGAAGVFGGGKADT